MTMGLWPDELTAADLAAATVYRTPLYNSAEEPQIPMQSGPGVELLDTIEQDA